MIRWFTISQKWIAFIINEKGSGFEFFHLEFICIAAYLYIADIIVHLSCNILRIILYYIFYIILVQETSNVFKSKYIVFSSHI